MSSDIETPSINWKFLCISLVAASLLWYTINARERIERVVDVRIDYKGLPSDLVVTSGLVNKVSVRLRGPLELLRSLANRELSYTMDLSGVTRGHNVIPVTWDPVQDLRALQIMEIIPPRLNLTVDSIIERRLPVHSELRNSPFGYALRMIDVNVVPELVTVRGPASVVASLKQVTVEVPADIESEGVLVDDMLPVLAPSAVDVSPASVRVERRLLISRRNLSLQREVLPYDDTLDYVIEPSHVSIVVAIPRSLVNDADYLSQFQAYLKPGTFVRDGETRSLLDVTIPQGAKLVRVNPPEVTLSHPHPGNME